jgi:uncharacterized membrane protein
MELATMDLRHVIILIHALAAAAGLGTVLTTDYLFFSFVKNGRISEQQVATMKKLSEVIWIALVVLILSGVYLALTKAGLGHSSKFLIKLVAVAALTINGLFLNFFVTPRMSKIAFADNVMQPGDEPDRIRKIAVFAGGVSIFSWVLSFILGKFRSIPISFSEALGGYLVIILLIGIFAACTSKKKA